MPVLLNLHGAGLEADSDQVRFMLDSVPKIEAWVLFPTGGTTWSGDDWRQYPCVVIAPAKIVQTLGDLPTSKQL